MEVSDRKGGWGGECETTISFDVRPFHEIELFHVPEQHFYASNEYFIFGRKKKQIFAFHIFRPMAFMRENFERVGRCGKI